MKRSGMPPKPAHSRSSSKHRADRRACWRVAVSWRACRRQERPSELRIFRSRWHADGEMAGAHSLDYFSLRGAHGGGAGHGDGGVDGRAHCRSRRECVARARQYRIDVIRALPCDRWEGKCPARAAQLGKQQRRRLLRHMDERGTHDRAPCSGACSAVGVKRAPRKPFCNGAHGHPSFDGAGCSPGTKRRMQP